METGKKSKRQEVFEAYKEDYTDRDIQMEILYSN